MSGQQESLYRLPARPGARGAVLWRMVALWAVGAVAGGWLAGGYMAWRLGYPRRFGEPWFLRPEYPDRLLGGLAVLLAAGGAAMLLIAGRRRVVLAVVPLVVAVATATLTPLYGPIQVIGWIHRYGAIRGVGRIVATAEAIGCAGMSVCFAAALGYGLLSLRQLARVGDLHGSSRWASRRAIEAVGLRGRGEGVVVGRLDGRWLVDGKDRHALVYAPSGTGKSTCVVIPTLLRWPGSVVALDIKGELWQRTAGYRQSQGQVVVRFDPTLPHGSAGYNPLLSLPRSDEDVAMAQDIADLLTNPEGRESSGAERFFEDSARGLLCGVILHLLYTESRPSLGSCLRLLSSPEPTEIWRAMSTGVHDPHGRRRWVDDVTGAASVTHPVVARAASRMLGMDARTATGVLATVLSKLVLFEDPLVCRNTSGSDFRGEDLVAGDRPVSVYLTVSPADLDRVRPLLRVVLNQISRQLTKEVKPGRRPVLLALDEFTALGKLDFILRSIAYFRGYGVRVLISIQSLEQLVEVYGPHQSIAANCALQIAYGANDLATARALSEMSGRRTVEYRRESRNRGLLGGRSTESEAEAGRPLLSPDEVRRLPEGEALIYVAGCAPIRAERAPYFRDRDLAQRAEVPPPEQSDRIARRLAPREEGH